MKLVNFASLDPAQSSRGVSGLRNSGKSDKVVWEEFTADWERLAVESEEAYRALRGPAVGSDAGISASPVEALEDVAYDPEAPTEKNQLMKVRLCQSFFRRAVLASYEGQCCVCSLPCEALLVASHIIPWTLRADLRANPKNGLCLCALHDRAFDRGLISVSPAHVIHTSKTIVNLSPHEVIARMFTSYDGTRIMLPGRFTPDPESLKYHFECLFQPN